MKRKVISLILSAIMLVCALPTISFADEGTLSAGAKLGVENGDTVIYAGKDGTPLKWRVANKDESNTGDSDGILLLSNETIEILESTGKDGWTVNACNGFYNDCFGDIYKNAVMTVSKTDEDYSDYGTKFKGSLPSGTTVFALSVDEFKALPDDLKKLDGKGWYLRSVSENGGYMFYYQPCYIFVEPTGQYSCLTWNSGSNIRPAVNLSKSKLASINDKLLLLPAGKFSEADGKFASVGTASEWKLSPKSNAECTTAFSGNNTANSLDLSVTTTENGYIGAVIMKPDGSISHYARYSMSGTELNQSVSLPSDVNVETDSMYVFYENYRNELSGEIGIPKKVCLKHDYGEYASVDGSSHKHTCRECGFEEETDHTFADYAHTEQGHERSCTECGFSETGNHEFTYTSTDTVNHRADCFCGYSVSVPHTYPEFGSRVSEIKCSDCGAVYFSAFKGELGSNILRDKYVADTDEIYKNAENETAAAITPDSTKKAALSFKTKSPIIAKGFQIKQREGYKQLPETITLYGKNEGDADYTKIETVAYKSVFNGKAADGTYTFLFSKKDDFCTYDNYKAEMSFGADYDASMPSEICFFGLISDAPLRKSIYFMLKGMVAEYPSDKMYPGEDYYLSLKYKNGYPDADKIILKVGDITYLQDDSSWRYYQDTGTMKIMKQFIEGYDMFIIKSDLYDSEQHVNINFYSDTLKKIGDDQVSFGKDYQMGFYVKCGISEYAPRTMDDITVKDNDGNEITDYCSLDENGKLHIPSSVIKGDAISIYAEETGRKKRDDKVYKVIVNQNGAERYFTDMAAAKPILELDCPTNVFLTDEIFSNEMPSEPINLKNKVVFSLGGHTMEAGSGNNLIFTTDGDADVNIKSGKIKAMSADGNTAVTAESGIVRLTDIKTEGFNNTSLYAYAANGGKIVVYGTSDLCVILGDGGALDMYGGVIESLEFNSDNVTPKFYGGTVKAAHAYSSSTDWISMIDNGYAYKLEDNSRYDELINGTKDIYQFSVAEVPQIFTVQPEDVTVERKDTSATITAAGEEGSTYLWVCSDNGIVEDNTFNNSELKIKNNADVGEYTCYCIIKNGSLVSRSRTAKITVLNCLHSKINEDGICESCGKQYAIKVTAGDTMQIFDSLYDAVNLANKNEISVIKLLKDVSESGKVSSDDSDIKNVEFISNKITLDLNGKTLKIESEDAHIKLYGALMTVEGNGTLDTQIDVNDGSTLIIENGTFKKLWCAEKSNVALNGGRFSEIECENMLYADLLGKGKAYRGVNDQKFNTDRYELRSFDTISDVEICEAPFIITEMPEGKYVDADSPGVTVSVGVKENEAYKGKTNYRWTVATLDPKYGYIDEEKLDENAATVEVCTTGFENGIHRVYKCNVSYDGYILPTDSAMFTIGKGKPKIEFENNYIDSKGNDCVLFLAAYDGDRFVGAICQSMLNNSDTIGVYILFDRLANTIPKGSNVSKIKAFFWDKQNAMPLAEVSSYDID